jgi:hypothetical protein
LEIKVITDFLIHLLGAVLIIAGTSLAVVTYRAATRGKRAYRANRRLASKNPFDAMRGHLNLAADSRERRSCSGMAIRLSDGKLDRQEKLSAEAIDEVIGRQI